MVKRLWCWLWGHNLGEWLNAGSIPGGWKDLWHDYDFCHRCGKPKKQIHPS